MSRDQWWLDYVEDELDKATRREMQSILKNSPKDQELVKSLSDTKTILQDFEEPLPNISEDFLDQLHGKIMEGVEKTEIKEKPKLQIRASHKRLAKSISISLVALIAAISLVRTVSNKSLNTTWDIHQQMARQVHENPDDLSQMMSYQSENDFFVDVASLSLDHLTKEQFESLLGRQSIR